MRGPQAFFGNPSLSPEEGSSPHEVLKLVASPSFKKCPKLPKGSCQRVLKNKRIRAIPTSQARCNARPVLDYKQEEHFHFHQEKHFRELFAIWKWKRNENETIEWSIHTRKLSKSTTPYDGLSGDGIRTTRSACPPLKEAMVLVEMGIAYRSRFAALLSVGGMWTSSWSFSGVSLSPA